MRTKNASFQSSDLTLTTSDQLVFFADVRNYRNKTLQIVLTPSHNKTAVITVQAKCAYSGIGLNWVTLETITMASGTDSAIKYYDEAYYLLKVLAKYTTGTGTLTCQAWVSCLE